MNASVIGVPGPTFERIAGVECGMCELRSAASRCRAFSFDNVGATLRKATVGPLVLPGPESTQRGMDCVPAHDAAMEPRAA